MPEGYGANLSSIGQLSSSTLEKWLRTKVVIKRTKRKAMKLKFALNAKGYTKGLW